MLTVPEFRVAATRHLRRVAWLLRAFSLSIGAIWLAFNVFPDPTGWFQAHIYPNFRLWLIYPTGLGGLALLSFLLIALLLIALLLNLWARRDSRLVCPHCNRGLARSWYRVIGTRKCPRCQREILTDPAPAVPPQLTRAEWEAVKERYARALRRGLILPLWMLMSFLIAACVGFGTEYLKDSGVIGETFATCVMCAGAVAFFVWVTWTLIRTMRDLIRRDRVICPRCGVGQEIEMIAEHEHCVSCSQPLVADPLVGDCGNQGEIAF